MLTQFAQGTVTVITQVVHFASQFDSQFKKAAVGMILKPREGLLNAIELCGMRVHGGLKFSNTFPVIHRRLHCLYTNYGSDRLLLLCL